jgi:hypothetical protein
MFFLLLLTLISTNILKFHFLGICLSHPKYLYRLAHINSVVQFSSPNELIIHNTTNK